MQANDLLYPNLTSNILRGYSMDGRTESASFLVWFLENILRLDDVQSADAICDGPNDRGIDSIYIDQDNSEIIFVQSKIRQDPKREIGDPPIRDFAGSIAQFDTPENVRAAIAADPKAEISKLLVRSETADRLSEGYAVKGIFVTNAVSNAAAQTAADALAISIFDRIEIADRFIESNSPDRIVGSATFDVGDTGCLQFSAGADAKLYLITAKASDLLQLGGLSDGALFAQNVRLSLGNTRVNRDVAKTIADRQKHLYFPMYHNGITLICRRVSTPVTDSLKVSNYVVVNGAQSLSVLYRNRSKISADLRLIVKIIEIDDNDQFARDITIASNNQNSIKPRDMRSTNLLQTRLKAEFEQIDFQQYRYLIKRGEEADGNVISNEEAGRILLAFDVREPWSCHQIYKVFDEKYTEIFGRPGVTAWRIILLVRIMREIESSLPQIGNEPLQRYRLTRYFLMYAVAMILKEDPDVGRYISDEEGLLRDTERLDLFLEWIRNLVRRLCVDVRFEFTEGESPPDYKSALKSPVQVPEIERRLRRSYLHDQARGRESMPSTVSDFGTSGEAVRCVLAS